MIKNIKENKKGDQNDLEAGTASQHMKAGTEAENKIAEAMKHVTIVYLSMSGYSRSRKMRSISILIPLAIHGELKIANITSEIKEFFPTNKQVILGRVLLNDDEIVTAVESLRKRYGGKFIYEFI